MSHNMSYVVYLCACNYAEYLLAMALSLRESSSMKAPQSKKPTAMNPATRAAIVAVLDTDAALSPAQRARIIAACDSIADPDPAPVQRGMSASAAARYLGKHPATLSRWIAEGKLTGEKVEGRFLLSPESVEAMRATLTAPARPVEPLPDRLAHLAAVVKPTHG